MRIGITEAGDAGIDLSWLSKQNMVDGLILVTKNVTGKMFRQALTELKKPFVLHCTCTGMGGTEWEPNVPTPYRQITGIKKLIDDGFVDKRNVVIRIDPINPCYLKYFGEAMFYVKDVLKNDYADLRYRISVMDYYPHVIKRLDERGLDYPVPKRATENQIECIVKAIERFPEITFETCAEPNLRAKNILHTGCVGWEDIRRMGLDENDVKEGINPQNRPGCMCLSCKTELLNHKQPCPHKCVYCYWKN